MSALKVTTGRRRQAGVEAIVQRITPAMAEKMLGKNVKNRNIRKGAVAAYARDMARDEWRLTGEAIKFDTDGNLIDGQHRLLAVIESGVTCDMLVITGLPGDAQHYLDAGARRGVGDQLALVGERNPNLLAAVIRRVVLWDNGTPFNQTTVTFSEHEAALEAEPTMRMSVDIASKCQRFIPVQGSVFGFVHHLCARIDSEAANHFFVEQVANSMDPSGPARALFQRFNRASISGQRLNEVEQTGYLMQAWNAWRAGDTRSRLQAPKGDGWLRGNLPTPV